MDGMITDTMEPLKLAKPSVMAPSGASQLLTAQPIEAAPKLAAGRLPLMAFVDAETERVLQESSVQFGRTAILRGGIAKAIEYLSEQRSPHLLIVDISGIDLPLSQIHTLADVCEPGTNVVAIGDHNDVGLYRDLVDAGVSNYIVKPLTRELLTRALTPKVNSGEVGRAGLKLGKMVSFVGARGGVGTTTLAANLAWHLANRQSRRVALVDLDLQNGDCALLFNINTTPGLRDALANPLRLDHLLLDRIMTQHSERLFVLSSEEPLHDNVQITASAIDSLFSVLRSQFHYIVVDVPRIPAPAYRRALEIADRRVIVVDQTMRAMRDAVRLTRMFGDSEIPGAERSAEHRNIFIVNRVGEHHALSLKDVQKVLQVQPTSLIPFLPSLVTPSAHHGLMAANKRGKFADAVATLALELSGRKRRQRWWRRATK
jgi:pilus assembly protein CpaE